MSLIRSAALTAGVTACLILLGLLLIAGCATLPPAPARVASERGAPPDPDGAIPEATRSARLAAEPLPLAAVFAPWYGYDGEGNCRGGEGSYHWKNGPAGWGVLDVPERGYYCSADPEIIKWQLDGLERAGVQALFVSWWGWGDGNLDGDVEGQPDASLNRGITALLDKIAATPGSRKIKVALIVEPFVQTQAQIEPRTLEPAQRAMILDWLWSNYYGNEKYRGAWFEWEGKPLLLAFDPMTLTLPLPPSYPISYTIRNWTGRARDAATVGEGWDWFFGPPQDPVDGLSSDGVTFVYPRFDEARAKADGAPYINWPARSVDSLLARCGYERQWQRLGEQRGAIKMVVVYGWNLYGEQAYIEPARADSAAAEHGLPVRGPDARVPGRAGGGARDRTGELLPAPAAGQRRGTVMETREGDANRTLRMGVWSRYAR